MSCQLPVIRTRTHNDLQGSNWVTWYNDVDVSQARVDADLHRRPCIRGRSFDLSWPAAASAGSTFPMWWTSLYCHGVGVSFEPYWRSPGASPKASIIQTD